MTTYVIGDVQGCLLSLEALLSEINFTAGDDKLIFAGDLVNRGPRSLATVKLIMELGDSAKTVLGNHDLYLLMCACGGRKIRTKDTFGDIMNNKRSEEILQWFASQPLLIKEGEYTIVHAGLLPQWTLSQAFLLAESFSQKLISLWKADNLKAAKDYFIEIWDNEPSLWTEDLSPIEKHRITVNSLTRIRAVNKKGKMNFSQKGEVADLAEGFYPWFDIPTRQTRGEKIICGHWSALGLHLTDNVSCIDTGCIWRRKLTALRLPDRKIFQVDFCD